MGKKTRKPSDYPSYAFRVPEADSEAVEGLIAQARKLMERQRSPGDPPITTGRVLARAVVPGLEALIRALTKK